MKNYFLIFKFLLLLSLTFCAHNEGEVDDIDDVLFNIRTEDDYFQKLDY